MRKVSLLVAVLLLCILFVVPVKAQEGSIVGIAAGNPDFSTLVAAVQAADPAVLQTLSGPGPFTVFAPNNQAFSNLASYLDRNYGLTLDDLLGDTELLTNLLLYHVVNGAVFSQQVATLNGQVVPTLFPGTGIGIVVNADGSIALNNGVARVIAADIAASNGVIHVINNVVFNSLIRDGFQALADRKAEEARIAALGNSIAGVIAADPDFSILFAVIEATGQTNNLTRGGPYTLFAPTNAAFEALLGAIGITPADALAQVDIISTVLRYHLLAGRVSYDDILAADGGSLESLLGDFPFGEGEAITVDVRLRSIVGGTLLNGSAAINEVDIQADNGVIHVINRVLLPSQIRMLLGM